ncbi:unnamed protein product [Moneuplotes crassus]|uniref:Uncharacterized protein n=1 Tax=Euplotes crassus TaxID=5936 RepID=A0AAD1UCB0_EUPCR|nr:unnamed protein product [Moneuplotes crassus]
MEEEGKFHFKRSRITRDLAEGAIDISDSGSEEGYETDKMNDQSCNKSMNPVSNAVGLSEIIDHTDFKRLREEEDLLPDLVERVSPFKLTHTSQIDGEIQDCDKTICDLLEQIQANAQHGIGGPQAKKKHDDNAYLSSVEKAKRKNYEAMYGDDKESPMLIGDMKDRILRDSGGDFGDFDAGLTEKDVEKAIDTYFEADLETNDNSLMKMMDSLNVDLPPIPSLSDDDIEAINIIQKLQNQDKKLDLIKTLQDESDHLSSLISLHSEYLSVNLSNLSNSIYLQALQPIETEYDYLKTNLEQMYFRLQTELWAYKMTVEVSEVVKSKFHIDLHYTYHGNNTQMPNSANDPQVSQIPDYATSCTIQARLFFRAINTDPYQSDLRKIEIYEAPKEILPSLHTAVDKAVGGYKYGQSDLLGFLQDLKVILWMYTGE